jgi:polar amino acid transport system substrate-binding protein
MKTARVLTLFVLLLAALMQACTPAAPKVVDPANPGCLGSKDTALVDLNCRKISVAVENAYMPFNYILVKTGKPGGWDYETVAEICTRLHCEPTFIESAWDGMIQSVADKQFDVGADGVTITDERKQVVDFSDGYINVDQRLLVRKGETRFTNIEEFASNPELIMGTQANTTNYETAKEYISEDRLKAFEQFSFAVQALISKDVDAVIIDETAGQGYRGENADTVELIGPSISGDELGFVFAKGSDLVDPFNKALAAMKADGTLEKLNAKYFGPDFKISSEEVK